MKPRIFWAGANWVCYSPRITFGSRFAKLTKVAFGNTPALAYFEWSKK